MTKIWKLDKADNTEQHFWTDTDGAHISSTGDHDTSGFHQLLTSVKNAFMHGTIELASFGENLIELGKNSKNAVIKMCAGTFSITKTTGSGVGDYASIKSDSQMLLMVPSGKTVAMTTYDSLGQPSDNGVGMIGNDAVIRGANVKTNTQTIPAQRFETAIQPVVLYNGGNTLTYDTAPGSGVLNAGITLSETAANFKKLIIYFRTDDNQYGGPAMVPFPNGKAVDLTCNVYNGGTNNMYVKSKAVSISGTSISTYYNSGYWTGVWGSDGTKALGDYIGIVRVEGIR